MDKNYNYQRSALILPEYGRHIQNMVDYLLTIEDRDLRSKQARTVVDIMANVNPSLREATDFKHKLWDHLFILSDYKLDVDSPYPMPVPEEVNKAPERIPYPARHISRKHYGQYVEAMLKSIKDGEDEEDKTIIASNIATFLRSKVFEFNQEHPSNDVIINDIRRMSDNMIIIDESAINNSKNSYKQPFLARSKKSSGSGKAAQGKQKNSPSKQGQKNGSNKFRGHARKKGGA